MSGTFGAFATPTKWNTEDFDTYRSMRMSMKEASGLYKGNECHYALGSDQNVEEIIVKFFNFPGRTLMPGDTIQFYMDIGPDGKITSDAWLSNVDAYSGPQQDGAEKLDVVEGVVVESLEN